MIQRGERKFIWIKEGLDLVVGKEKVTDNVPPWKTLPTPYRIAFQQDIEDLAHIIGDIEGRIGTTRRNVDDNTLGDDDIKLHR